MRVTVVPDDNLISVNGEGLVFFFPKDPNMHALQWAETAGHIEYKPRAGVMPPATSLAKRVLQAWCSCYVMLHAQEKGRLVAEAQRKLDEYDSEPARLNACGKSVTAGLPPRITR